MERLMDKQISGFYVNVVPGDGASVATKVSFIDIVLIRIVNAGCKVFLTPLPLIICHKIVLLQSQILIQA